MGHVRADKATVLGELVQARFAVDADCAQAAGLKENWFVVFKAV